jgi:hypothetical protein
MSKKVLLVLVLTILLGTVVIAGKALPRGVAVAQSDEMNHTISVSGIGTVEVNPDIAYLNAGVTVENKDPAQANAIVEALKKAGVKKEEIKTTGLSLYPVYSWDPDTGKQTLEGYRASESFSIKAELSNAGKLLTIASKNGATDIQGIVFDVSNKDELKLKAIEDAMKDARAKADAALIGTSYKVTGIKTISVESAPVYPVYRDMLVKGAEANVPVEGGTIGVDANVSVVFIFD